MNLFILDRDPFVAASMNCDKHVCKIILEACQMLSLAHIEHGATSELLWNARTHRNNHVSIWVRTTMANYEWTVNHAHGLLSEYSARYKKTHSCENMIDWFDKNRPPLPDSWLGDSLTPFRQAVAADCYMDDPVQAYHLYYVRYKRRFATWRNGNVPAWFTNLCREQDEQIDQRVAVSFG